MRSSRWLALLLTLLALVAAAAAVVALASAFYAEFAAEHTDVGREPPAVVAYNRKRQWENDVALGGLCVFEIPECKRQIFARLHPVQLMRREAATATATATRAGSLQLFGALHRAAAGGDPTVVVATGVSVSSFYFWSWNRLTPSTANYMNRAYWYSRGNAAFLRATRLADAARELLDPLLAPISMCGAASAHDLLLLSHRTPIQSLPYFVHFLSRRVLCAAHGAIRVHYTSWTEAQRHIVPSECAMPPSGDGEGEVDGAMSRAAWVLSAQCNLRRRTRMRHLLVREGQMLLVPPATVYIVEHVPTPTAAACCVVMQSDFGTLANRIKNRLFTPPSPSPAQIVDADEDTRSALLLVHGEEQLAEKLTRGDSDSNSGGLALPVPTSRRSD